MASTFRDSYISVCPILHDSLCLFLRWIRVVLLSFSCKWCMGVWITLHNYALRFGFHILWVSMYSNQLPTTESHTWIQNTSLSILVIFSSTRNIYLLLKILNHNYNNENLWLLLKYHIHNIRKLISCIVCRNFVIFGSKIKNKKFD